MKGLKRRAFIKNTLMAGAATAVSSQFLKAAESKTNLIKTSAASSKPGGKKIIVAGAGISGLCCAYELMKAGHDVTVLEASGRYGGHIFTGRDGLSDGLYADFGADHITKPGYEKFFDYVAEFGLRAIPYPNAEGSEAASGGHVLKMIGGRFYTEEMLKDRVTLSQMGFNAKEIAFLVNHPWYQLSSFYLKPHLARFKDSSNPFLNGMDDLDMIPLSELFKKAGASQTALNYLGGSHQSALYGLWRMAQMNTRGIPSSEGETFHLKGGNEQLPMAFAKRLGKRLKLSHAVLGIKHTASSVSVQYKAFGHGEERELQADFLVNCITLPIFKTIPISPALSVEKQHVVDNMAYSSHPFFVFEASSRFWLEDGFKSINMQFEHPDISSIWEETNEVDTDRIILKAYGPGGLSPQRVLAAFREVYPGKKDTIEQALTKDWTKDKYAPVCEMEPFPIGEMHKFWPQLMVPEGRIYFAGTYADPLSRGMESCIRSAQRIAREISLI